MKIIKHGNPPIQHVKVRYKCLNCGCEFEADVEDMQQSDFNDNYFICECPDCHKKVGEMVPDMPDKAITVYSETSFHGEDWYICPKCGNSFEYWSAKNNGNRCQKCNQRVRFR